MKSVGLVGFGVSSKALFDYFSKGDYNIFVHLEKEAPLPSGATGIFGKDYLLCNEDLVFRSPSVRPDKIVSSATPICESTYALSLLDSKKIGVTGSDGKTTTSTLIGLLLEAYGKNVFLGGNIGVPIINSVNKGYEYCVCELSSFQLMDTPPSLDVAIITSITENHLDWHKDINEYICSKKSILEKAKRCVLPYDNELIRSFAPSKGDVAFVSLNDISHLACDKIYLKDNIIYKNSTPILSIDNVLLRGKFNLLNLMLAIGAMPYIDISAIRRVAYTFKGVPHRLELVRELSGVCFYNSSIDTTPSRALATLSAFEKEKTIIILGGYDKNLSYQMLKEGLEGVKCAILLGESKDKIAPHIKRPIFVNNMSEAVGYAYKIAKPGDSVLLSPACASFDMFSSYKERGECFKKLVNLL